jgi:hypothetical protein
LDWRHRIRSRTIFSENPEIFVGDLFGLFSSILKPHFKEKAMTKSERMIEVFNRLDHNGLCWPNWLCNETALAEFVRKTLGSGADLEAGFADGGRIRVAGSNQHFRLVMFIRPAEQGGWEATERLLIPEKEYE